MNYKSIIATTLAVFLGFMAIAPQARAESSLEIFTITSSGNPVGDVPFEVYTTTGELFFKNQTDNMGRFTFNVGRAGEFNITARWKDGQVTETKVIIGPGLNGVKLVAPTTPFPVLTTSVAVAQPTPTQLTADEIKEMCKLIGELKPGTRSEGVKRLQELLRRLGITFFNSEPTGFYGSLTERAAMKASNAFCKTTNGDVPEPGPGVPGTTVVQPTTSGANTNEVREAARILQELVVQMRQLLGQFEKVLSLLRSSQ